MTPEALLEALEDLVDAPNGIGTLRQLVLQLAVQGRLVQQDPRDESADVLLDRIGDEKARLITAGSVPRPRTLSDRPTSIEPPFELPIGWSCCILDDVAAYIQRGKSPKYDDESPVRVVSQKCVQWTGFDLSRARGIQESSLEKYGTERFLVPGDLLWNSTGTGTVGRVGIYPDTGVAQVVADSHVTVVRLVEMAPQFVWIWLAGPAVQSAIDDLTTGSTKQQELNSTTVRLQPVPIPPVQEQHRIVARVDELMALLDRLEAAKEARDATRAQLRDAALAALQDAGDAEEVKTAWSRIADHMHDLFTDPADIPSLREAIRQLAVRGRLVEQVPSDQPANGILELADVRRAEYERDKRIRKQKGVAPLTREHDPFPVPQGWTWCRIDDAFYVSGGLQKSGKRRPVKNSFPYLRVANVQRGRLELDELAEFELFDGELEKLRLEAGDLLVVEGNGSRSEIGRCARWTGEVANCVHQNHLIRCRPLQPEIEEFVLLFLNSPTGTETMASLAVTTSGLYNLSVGKIRAIPIPLPPIAEQRRIIAKVQQLMTLLDRLEASLSDMRATQEAFSASAVRALPEEGVEASEESAVTVG